MVDLDPEKVNPIFEVDDGWEVFESRTKLWVYCWGTTQNLKHTSRGIKPPNLPTRGTTSYCEAKYSGHIVQESIMEASNSLTGQLSFCVGFIAIYFQQSFFSKAISLGWFLERRFAGKHGKLQKQNVEELVVLYSFNLTSV